MRKRSTEDTTDRTASHRKISKSGHVTDSRRKGEANSAPESPVDKSSASKRRKTKRSDAPSILSPRGASKFSKRRRKGFLPKPAVSLITPPAEEEVTFQNPNAQLATLATSSKGRGSTALAPQSALLRRVYSSRVSKAQGRTLTQVSPETPHTDDAWRSSRKGKRKDNPTTARGDMRSGRKQQQLADAPVRRNPRLSKKPKIRYPK